MSVLIGHASIDENKKARGGQAGDQTLKEVCTRTWYANSWAVLLRPVDATIADKSAAACIAACSNNHIGYDQNERNTLHTQAKKVNYDMSKITVSCETDCSAFMTVCAIAGGVKELEYTNNAPNTSSMVDKFVKTGKYQKLTDSKYLTSDEYLQRGDILVVPGLHTVMVLSDGSKVNKKATSVLKYPCRGVDVAQWQTGIDYEIFKQRGVQFAIIKIIRKNNDKDPMFETHYNGFTKAGIQVLGCYNYSYATTVEQAREDARAVIKALNGRKMVVFFDTEDNVQKNMGKQLIAIINAYQEVIENAGLQFAIYSGLSFTKNFLAPYVNDLKCKDIWIARYYLGDRTMYIQSALDDTKRPAIPGFNVIGWQYTSKGRIADGYNGVLDMSIMYKEVSQMSDVIDFGIVSATSLRVRNLPSEDDGIILGYLVNGSKVLIYEIVKDKKGRNWYRINSRTDDPQWVCGDYVQKGG